MKIQEEIEVLIA